MNKAVLFDLDGTLTDPFEGISRCYRYALERLNVDVDPQFDFRSLIGPPMLQAFESLGIGADRAAKGIEHYRERFRAEGLYENALYPGIVELLEQTKQRYRLFVCTSKPAEFALEILRYFEIGGFFEDVYGSELSGRFAHKPELLAHLLKRERISGEDTIMVGDREHDVIAALENRVTAFGAAWGYGSTEELQAAGAQRVFASPAELATALTY